MNTQTPIATPNLLSKSQERVIKNEISEKLLRYLNDNDFLGEAHKKFEDYTKSINKENGNFILEKPFIDFFNYELNDDDGEQVTVTSCLWSLCNPIAFRKGEGNRKVQVRPSANSFKGKIDGFTIKLSYNKDGIKNIAFNGLVFNIDIEACAKIFN